VGAGQGVPLPGAPLAHGIGDMVAIGDMVGMGETCAVGEGTCAALVATALTASPNARANPARYRRAAFWSIIMGLPWKFVLRSFYPSETRTNARCPRSHGPKICMA
jgi:hypothetical protein